MAKSTFTINEKANKASLVSTDRFLLETSADTTMSASLDAIYAYCALTLASTSGTLDHTKLTNIGSKTHTQIDAFINNATSLFASASQGAKADTAIQPTDNIDKSLVGLDKVDNTSDLDKPISSAVQIALDKKSDRINTKSIIYVDNSITDINTSTGIISNPFTSLSSAFSYILSESDKSHFTILLSSSIYTEGDLTVPDKQIFIYCNGANINSNLFITNSNFKIYDGIVSGNLNFSFGLNRALLSRMIIDVSSQFKVSGKLDIVESTINSELKIESNSDCRIRDSIINNRIINAGIFELIDSVVLTDSSDYAIDSSTQGSKLIVKNSKIRNNLGTGVNCANAADSNFGNYNEITDCIISSATSPCLFFEGAYLKLSSTSVNNSCIGSSLIAKEADSIGAALVSFGSDANGDIYYRETSGRLKNLKIGLVGQILASTGTRPEWIDKPVNIAGNAATSTLSEQSSKLATARKINGVDFDGTKDIEITMLDGVSANIMAELDVTNGDVYIDETNGGYAGYIITGSPSHNVSIFIKLQNRYYKFINNITTNYAVAIESGE